LMNLSLGILRPYKAPNNREETMHEPI